MDTKKHYSAAVAAFLVWGFFPLVLRTINTHAAGEILYFRILFSLFILSVIVLGFMRSKTKENIVKFKSLQSREKTTVVLLTLAGGLLLTLNWLVFIYVVNNVNIKTASFSYLICPIITAVLGFLLLKEQMTTLQWMAILLCAISCVLIGFNNMSELGYALFIALSYALYLITQRKNQGFNRMIVLAVQVLFSFVLLNLFFNQLMTEPKFDLRFYTIVFAIAIAFTVFPLFLNLYALNRINAATIGILMYINPLMNFAIAFLIIHESANTIQVIGYGIIGVALVIFNYPILARISKQE
jgi:chloramphenicol-sensitive protein RarD